VLENSFHKPVFCSGGKFLGEWVRTLQRLCRCWRKLLEEFSGELLAGQGNCDEQAGLSVTRLVSQPATSGAVQGRPTRLTGFCWHSAGKRHPRSA